MTRNKGMAINNSIFGKDGIISKILESSTFLWLVALTVFLCWYFQMTEIGIIILFALAFLVFVFCEDTTPAIMIFVTIGFIFNDKQMTFDAYSNLAFYLLLPIIGAVINAIRFKGKLQLKGFTMSVIICLIPWLLQGIGRDGRATTDVLILIGIAFAFCLIFLFFAFSTRKRGVDFVNKMCLICFIISILLCAQFLTVLAKTYIGGDKNILGNPNASLHFGWGGRNNISTLISLTMPSAFYFATKKSKASFLFAILGFAEFLCVMSTNSRGAILFACAIMPFVLVYTLIKAKHKIPIVVVYLCVVVVVLLMEFLPERGFIDKAFVRFTESGFDSTGRENLFNVGWELFFKYPVFGGGFDFKHPLYYQYLTQSNGPTYYHSTFIQIFACLGLVGAIAYFYLYYWRYRIVFTDVSCAKIFLFFGMMMFELYNMVDTNFFQPHGYLIMLFISLAMEKGLTMEQASPAAMHLLKSKIKRKCYATL